VIAVIFTMGENQTKKKRKQDTYHKIEITPHHEQDSK
jgi:hypothetical protein